MVREILVDWTTASGAGKVSVLYFLDTSPVAAQRAALEDFLQAARATQHVSTVWRVRQVGRELATATGTLTGEWTDPVPYEGAGNVTTGSPAADATQALVRWRTGNIVGGRFLQGRTFLPGIATSFIAAGNLSGPGITAISTAAQALADAGVQLAVWHRPVGGGGGTAWAVESGTAWSELAVLRRRRG